MSWLVFLFSFLFTTIACLPAKQCFLSKIRAKQISGEATLSSACVFSKSCPHQSPALAHSYISTEMKAKMGHSVMTVIFNNACWEDVWHSFWPFMSRLLLIFSLSSRNWFSVCCHHLFIHGHSLDGEGMCVHAFIHALN